LEIVFFPPIDAIMGASMNLDTPEWLTVGEVLQLLEDRVPEFAPYGGFEKGDTQPRGLLVWRDHMLLNLKDLLKADDRIEVIPMVAGG